MATKKTDRIDLQQRESQHPAVQALRGVALWAGGFGRRLNARGSKV